MGKKVEEVVSDVWGMTKDPSRRLRIRSCTSRLGDRSRKEGGGGGKAAGIGKRGGGMD